MLFDRVDEAILYLKQYEARHPDSLQPIHDACLFDLPTCGMWDITTWRGLVMKYGEKASNLLDLAPKIEAKIHGDTLPIEILERFFRKQIDETQIQAIRKKITEGFSKHKDNEQKRQKYIESQVQLKIKNHVNDQLRQFILDEMKMKDPTISRLSTTKQSELANAEIKKRRITEMSFEKIIDYALSIAYQRKDENAHLAKECILNAISEERFNRVLDIFQTCDKKEDHLPFIVIDGADKAIDQSHYYFTKLPKDDPRGLILGKYTNSCQSIGGNAEAVAIHGMQSDDGGFYVIMKKSTEGKMDPYHDEIVAQSWAWLSEKDNLVFDSLELRRLSQAQPFLKFYEQAAHQAIGWKIHRVNDEGESKETRITRVTLGTGGQTPKGLAYEKAVSPELFRGVSLYDDSMEQWVLKENKELVAEKVLSPR